MKTIVFASQKGGSGKTTLAGPLGVPAEKAGNGPCVLIDTDPQASFAAWWNGRTDGRPQLAPVILKELAAKLELLGAAGFSYAFIDTPPAIAEFISAVVMLAGFALIPTRPSPMIYAPYGARSRWQPTPAARLPLPLPKPRSIPV